MNKDKPNFVGVVVVFALMTLFFFECSVYFPYLQKRKFI